ncbi:MAG TPA: c-type cytochrome [Tahibacter sp.]|uniref:c-type cytochrome n=1 Tax=Tahibacter sp. TaxID=2056211 RepID=UPI002C6BFF93|nr:c-type cytochrome [Tahibacter sp.]HSX59006.1 c-type cytochrome [Tahibacter sp.]
MKTCRPLLLLISMLATPGFAADDAGDLTERLAACSACHGARGEGRTASEYYPHLAGKPAGYLLSQLRAFRDGGRNYPQMGWLMRNMDDAYLERIATHFAALPPRANPSDAAPKKIDPALARRAQALIADGDATRGIPACAACHGADLAGLEPAIPALVALPEEYVVAQFGGWRTGVRTARQPDCMASIARALEPAEIRAIAAWLSAQQHTEALRPAPAGSFVPPQACADLPHAAVQP